MCVCVLACCVRVHSVCVCVLASCVRVHSVCASFGLLCESSLRVCSVCNVLACCVIKDGILHTQFMHSVCVTCVLYWLAV